MTSPIPFVRTSRTSRLAAQSMRPFAQPIALRMLRLIVARGSRGYTCAELEARLGGDMRQSTVSARVKDLKDGGLVVVVGERPSPRGRLVDVLAATAKGQKAVRDA